MAFASFNISDISTLVSSSRALCPACGCSCFLYCAPCLLPLNHTPPAASLPLPMDIYRHPQENTAKTTSVHAALLSKNVNLYVSDTLHHYDDPSRVLLLFPSPTSVPLSTLKREDFDRVVVIDGTWRQAKAMVHSIINGDVGNDDNLNSKEGKSVANRGFVHVRINEHDTLFWRFQKYSRTYLATIEAVYWFYRDYFDAFQSGEASQKLNVDELAKVDIEAQEKEIHFATEVEESIKNMNISKEYLLIQQDISDKNLATKEDSKTLQDPSHELPAPNPKTLYDGRYDNLLFYFKLHYTLIQNHYKDSKKTFTARHALGDGYIKRKDDDELKL